MVVKVYRTVVRSMIASSLLCLGLTGTVIAGELAPDLVPNPALTASDVVRIQLGALANNDSPYQDAGIEITFRFASPDNKKVTGPLPRFIQLVKNPQYGPMLNHLSVEYGEPSMEEGRKMIPVLLTGSDGNKAAYVFIVGQQDIEECQGCWMTEGVFRIRLDGMVVPKVGT